MKESNKVNLIMGGFISTLILIGIVSSVVYYQIVVIPSIERKHSIEIEEVKTDYARMCRERLYEKCGAGI